MHFIMPTGILIPKVLKPICDWYTTNGHFIWVTPLQMHSGIFQQVPPLIRLQPNTALTVM
ncbi:hypothetical protein SAMN04488121_11737 [Chitinophaga filiformis]|uniref:Uncharacterized protein n=1 Tax=Chitinophaga filiformis TaxID=104663 RepID=A0A1G8E8U4_CHIFI|nr:hypothetical protein SAMN04488121_11737 [Chitinophaga filiformis]